MKAKSLAVNQTVITDDDGNVYFQSYDSIIVKIEMGCTEKRIQVCKSELFSLVAF